MYDLVKAFALDLGHTPGYFYALAYVLSALVFLSTAEHPRLRTRCVLVTLGFYLTLTGLMVATDGVEGWLFVLTMSVVFTIVFLYFLLVDDFSWQKALYFAIRSFILGELAASLQWQFFRFSVLSLGLPFTRWSSILFAAAVYAFVFMITWLIEVRYRSYNIEFQPPAKTVLLFLLLGVSIYILSNLSFTAVDTPFSGNTDSTIFAIRTLADLSGAWVMLAFHMQNCEVYVRMEKENLNTLLRMQEESYRISAESIEVVNRKYHDMKYQIALLKSNVPQENKLAFLEEMEQEISAYEARCKTGNKTLDILLSAKTIQCQKEGITLTLVADGKELDFMKPSDISVLFGNALDNAIESVSKILEPEKRLIHLSVASQRSFVHIRLENCCEEKLSFRDGLPITTKNDATYHGFGMKSMRKITEQYDGTLTAALKDGWFELRILLPIPSDRGSEGGK